MPSPLRSSSGFFSASASRRRCSVSRRAASVSPPLPPRVVAARHHAVAASASPPHPLLAVVTSSQLRLLLHSLRAAAAGNRHSHFLRPPHRRQIGIRRVQHSALSVSCASRGGRRPRSAAPAAVSAPSKAGPCPSGSAVCTSLPQQGQTHRETTSMPPCLATMTQRVCSRRPASASRRPTPPPSNKDRGGRLAGRLASKLASLSRLVPAAFGAPICR
jgi:hypothetical protein